MAVLKCKMCGGTLEVKENDKLATCDFCGTNQTVPTAKDEVEANLFNRANNLRIRGEFDKAGEIYEKMISEGSTDSESYWGAVLCKYGIEYVEDPSSHERIPTCHRAQFESVVTDSDYLSAIEYADSVQKGIYEKEANKIDEIQKNILSISQNEEPFDVFICYKETDESGQRTQDSVIANDIYHQLTQEGLRVFYAAITLESKLGAEYEPYIFAALNSAKVMLVIGTKPEYFNAVWVKNEWSRFIKIVAKSNGKKIMIPCYRDMDAYDLPEEFAHLQAQDMSKIGFIQDVIRGVKKITDVDKSQEVVKETVVSESANGNISALLKRGFMALEDGEWQKADDFFEQVLNFDAELAEAYLGKLLSEIQNKNIAEFKNCSKDLSENSNFKKALRFANGEYKELLEKHVGKTNDAKEIQKKIDMEKVSNKRNKIKELSRFISVGNAHVAALSTDGTVVATGDNQCGQCDNLRNWRNIVSVCCGAYFTVGLKTDGTVVAVGDNDHGQCDVNSWTNIIAIDAGWSCTVGLKSDGTVVATGDNQDGQCNISSWTNIASIKVLKKCTVGIKTDGTVVTTLKDNVSSNWTDVVDVFELPHGLIAIKKDGSIELAGDESLIKKLESDRSVLENIAEVSCSYGVNNPVCILKEDGTVYAIGGTYDVSKWNNVISVDCIEWLNNNYAIGLKSNGSVVTSGYSEDGRCDLGLWHDIVLIKMGENITVGLKSDGTVVAVGGSYYGKCDTRNWKLFISSDTAIQEYERNTGKNMATEILSDREQELYDLEMNEVEKRRSAEKEKEYNALKQEHTEKLKEIEAERTQVQTKYSEEFVSLPRKKKELQDEMASAGLFAFSKKSEIKGKIAEIESKIAALPREMEKALAAVNAKKGQVNKDYSKKEKDAMNEIVRKFPAPPRSSFDRELEDAIVKLLEDNHIKYNDILSKFKVSELNLVGQLICMITTDSISAKVEDGMVVFSKRIEFSPPTMEGITERPLYDGVLDNDEIVNLIENHMMDGGIYTIAQLQEEIYQLSNVTNQRMSALIRQHIGTKFERIEKDRCAYFKLI